MRRFWRKNGKRAEAAVLAMILALSLTACGASAAGGGDSAARGGSVSAEMTGDAAAGTGGAGTEKEDSVGANGNGSADAGAEGGAAAETGKAGTGASGDGTAAGNSAAEDLPELDYDFTADGFETVDAEGSRITTGRDASGARAMASASKYEVSQAGAVIMSRGGNAVDAAVAMGFALGVCEPFTSGLGGGGMAVIHMADGRNIFVDFRETAPAAATLDRYVNGCSTTSGGLASGVPGETAGLLYLLDHYGTMSRQEVMEPAIRIAEEGFTVSAYCANAIAGAAGTAGQYPEFQKVYWKEDGQPYRQGDVITNPGLARALRMIADEGADAFYTGEIAQAVTDTLARYGGVMTMEDLAGYRVREAEPVKGEYRGYTVISSPPPSSGGTHLIEILNILENYDVGSLTVNSPEYIHLFAEAYKLAFADRARYMADPAFADVPLDGLTSQEYADVRAALIRPDTAMEEAAPDDPTVFEHTDTTHFSVADAAGNCVSITKTINDYFGSGIMVDGFGFMMNDEMDDFSTDPNSVNRIEPGKKPLSSMTPTVILREDGSPFLVLGTPGGSRIFSTVAQVVSRVVDHGMSVHDAICVPRIWNCSSGNKLDHEMPLKGYEQYAVTEETAAALRAMGHGDIGTASSGAVQAIQFMEDGSLYGTADPRQDGKAVGY